MTLTNGLLVLIRRIPMNMVSRHSPLALHTRIPVAVPLQIHYMHSQKSVQVLTPELLDLCNK